MPPLVSPPRAVRRRQALLGVAAVAAAASAAPAPRVAAAPEASWLYPAGGQRGSTVEVEVGGAAPHWPPVVWCSDPDVEATPRETAGKLRIAVSDAARPHVAWIRLADRDGAAPPRPWIVGKLPESVEAEPNDAVREAQPVDLEASPYRACVVNGRLQAAGDVDVFRVIAQAGQTLVADLDAQTELGTPLDAVLQILRPDGFVAAQNDDQLQLDPQLAYPLPQEGAWMVRVFGFPQQPGQSIQFAGDERFVYRLTVATGPVVQHAVPLAARPGSLNRWRLFGWNLSPELRQLELAPPPDRGELTLDAGQFGRSIEVPTTAEALVAEVEPNAPANPAEVPFPAVITGCIDDAYDRDAFEFSATEGETAEIQIASRQLGYPLDPLIELQDAEGRRLAHADDDAAARDPRLTHPIARTGKLRLVVADRFQHGGPDHVYRLTLGRAAPQWGLSAEVHQVVLPAGGSAEAAVVVERRHGFAESVRVQAASLPPGVAAEPVVSEAGGETAGKVVLRFTARADAAAASVPLRIVGQSGDGPALPATFVAPGSSRRLADLWLTVAPAP